MAFAHAALFSPALSTLENALADGFLINLPRLTLATLRQHPPHSIAEIKGHLDQTHQNLRSNQKFPTIIHDDALTISSLGAANLHPLCIDTPTNKCLAAALAPTGQICTDQRSIWQIPPSLQHRK